MLALERDIAHSLDVEDPELLPFLPDLLQDFDSLGSEPEDIVAALREAGLRHDARIIDLGCGKGASAVAIARQLRCELVGVDGFAPFVAEAKCVVGAYGLSTHCDFRRGDLRSVVAEGIAYDAVLLLAVGPLFGNHSSTVLALRRCAKPGGLIVIADMYLAPGGRGHVSDYAGHAHREETLRRLTAYGDRLRSERLRPEGQLADVERRNTEVITRRAEELARVHPWAAAVLEAFVVRQRELCEASATRTVDALWVLERAPGP